MAPAPTSATDSIKNNVNALRETAGGHKNYAPVKQFNAPNQTTQQRYTPIMHSVAKWNANQPLDEKDRQQIAAASIVIAQKRGLPADSNGNYPKDKLDEILASPQNMLKQLSSHYLNDAQNAAEEDQKEQAVEAARKDIIETVQSTGGNSDTIQIVQQVKPFISDEAYVSMSDEERASLDMDPADRAAKESALKQSDEEKKKAAARINAQMDDPDWGHKKDDDDFKIEQGDIIEYLMKEVILASAAWVGNKAAGFAGTVIFEMGSTVSKEALPWLRDRKTAIATKWDKIFDHGPSYASMTGNCDENINNLKENLNDLSRSPKKMKVSEHLKLQLLNHLVLITKNGLIDNQGETLSYKDLKTSESDIRKLQGAYDALTLNTMLKNMEIDPNDTKKQQDIAEWIKKHNEYQESCLRNNEVYDVDKIPEPKAYLKHLLKAREETTTFIAFQVEKNLLQTQTELFAETYLKYRLEQENRNNPENPIFSDREKSKKFVEEEKLKATHIFLLAEQARRRGETELNGVKLMSREGMLEAVEKMAAKARKENVADTIFEPIVSGQKTTQEAVTTLSEAAQKADPAETYAAESNNLKMQMNEVQNQVSQTDEARKKVEETKKRITEKQKGLDTKASTINSITSNLPNTRPIPIRNKPQNQGSH